MSSTSKRFNRLIDSQALLAQLNYRNLAIAGFIVLVAFCRIAFGGKESLGVWAHFTPIGAMALFGGAYFSRFKALAFPLLTLWISDIYLNRFVYYGEWRFFYEGFYWTYGAFVMMVLTGRYLLSRVSVTKFLLASVLVTFIHWTVTNLSACMTGGFIQPTLTGYLASLRSSIPYEINFLIGTLIYGAIAFGLFEWLQSKHKLFKLPEIKIVER